MKTEYLIETFCTSLFARGRSPRTVSAYRRRLRRLVGVNEMIEQIQPEDVDRLIGELRQNGLAAATLASAVQSIKTFFSWCVKRGYLRASPASDLNRPKVELDGRSKAISQADLDRLFEEARREENALGLAALYMLADTGCRAGELLALNLEDLNLDCHEAQARGKTGARMLDFTDTTEVAVCAYLKQRPQTDPRAVFTTSRGRLTEWGLYKLLWRLARHVGVKRFNPQSIRHRVGQGWIDSGANLELVRLKLGHKDITTTSRYYAHQDRPRMRSATRRFSLVK